MLLRKLSDGSVSEIPWEAAALFVALGIHENWSYLTPGASISGKSGKSLSKGVAAPNATVQLFRTEARRPLRPLRPGPMGHGRTPRSGSTPRRTSLPSSSQSLLADPRLARWLFPQPRP